MNLQEPTTPSVNIAMFLTEQNNVNPTFSVKPSMCSEL